MTTFRPLLLLTLLLASVHAIAPASAAELSATSPAEQVVLDYLRTHPGGTLVSSTEISYADGSGFVSVEVGTMSLSECASGRFCMWASTSYTGSFTYVTGTGTKTIDKTVKSIWNNRSQGARLYSTTGSASTCYAPGAKASALATTYQKPTKVYLSTGTAC